jgi:hypothetical protein
LRGCDRLAINMPRMIVVARAISSNAQGPWNCVLILAPRCYKNWHNSSCSLKPSPTTKVWIRGPEDLAWEKRLSSAEPRGSQGEHWNN